MIFQLTRSRGAWPLWLQNCLCCIPISTHTLTWSVTVPYHYSNRNLLFQLTRSRGAWRDSRHRWILLFYFNSHAHVERDSCHFYNPPLVCHFNSHAHVERDSILLQCLFPFRYFNSHAHVERDHCQITPPYVILYFNSHAHVERDVSGIWSVVEDVGFQLTRSRGAWQKYSCYRHGIQRFQLTRSRGAWLSMQYVSSHCLIFQLTRSRGAWLLSGVLLLSRSSISTHTLTWSVTF